VVKEADLVFVIGTSLKVWPFAYLAEEVPQGVPILLINNEDCMPHRNKVWLNGDIQENVRNIAK
jgi:NAD-dependent SIR2 family protein deacetylase